MRARPSCTSALPWLAVRMLLQMAKVYIAIADATTARHLLREIDDILLHRPSLGVLVDEVAEFRAVLGIERATAEQPADRRSARPRSGVLPYLQTHLTMPEIAGRLFVSHNTVRSQVGSIYRKFGVSSRSDAVQHATTLGLLGA